MSAGSSLATSNPLPGNLPELLPAGSMHPAAVGGLASIILLVVIGGAAGLVLEGSSGEEMELR